MITIALHTQRVLLQNRQDVVDVIARIDHNGFVRLLVAEDRAIALQHPHRQNFMDHFSPQYTVEVWMALRESAAWLDLSARGKIRVTGEDRARLLHAMTTQDVQSLTPGQGCYAFFLNAQGRILGDANIFCREDSFLLDTEPETRQKLYDHIDRYIIADDVTLEDATGEMATIAIEGPQAAAVLDRLGAPVPEADYATRSWSGTHGRPREFNRGRRLLDLHAANKKAGTDSGPIAAGGSRSHS